MQTHSFWTNIESGKCCKIKWWTECDLLIFSGFIHGQKVTRGYLVISDMDKKRLLIFGDIRLGQKVTCWYSVISNMDKKWRADIWWYQTWTKSDVLIFGDIRHGQEVMCWYLKSCFFSTWCGRCCSFFFWRQLLALVRIVILPYNYENSTE